jgi:hypothetical protein
MIVAITGVRGNNRVDVKRDMLIKAFLENGFCDGSANERALERTELLASAIDFL